MKTITAKLVVSDAVAARWNGSFPSSAKRTTKKRRATKKKAARKKRPGLARRFGPAPKRTRRKSTRGNPDWAKQGRNRNGQFTSKRRR